MWPTLIVDNFFEDPNKIVKFSKTLKFSKAKDNSWPGTRTSPLHEIDHEFFIFTTKKILSILYPMNVDNLKWRAVQSFQRSNKEYGEAGWVHSDTDSEITVIIYLSDHANSGTCLYEGKNFPVELKYDKEKQRFFKDLTDLKRMEKYRDQSNSEFTKKVELFSNFNRLVLFDSHHWHASRNAGSSKEDRLTLITFFKEVTGGGIKYPIPTMRRLQ
tara:strand:- start:484 stop:1128 length:645 start_codon:yes stop_codon:yes gene_type:complete